MKKNNLLFWTTTSFIFLFEGVMPLSALLFAFASVTEGPVQMGYPAYFVYALIVFKVIGSIVLIIPHLPKRLKEWAYAGFAFDFIFASISHFVMDGVAFVSFFPLIILAILAVSYINYFKLYDHSQSRSLQQYNNPIMPAQFG